MIAIIGVGANLGPRDITIEAARELLDSVDGLRVRSCSPLYETEPVGPPQPRYLNGAFRVETSFSPSELLDTLLRVEQQLGRDRGPAVQWGPRVIDLDVLWCDAGPVELPGLHVPHRELQNRAFALAPLLDVAPELSLEYGPILEQLGGAPPRWRAAPGPIVP